MFGKGALARLTALEEYSFVQTAYFNKQHMLDLVDYFHWRDAWNKIRKGGFMHLDIQRPMLQKESAPQAPTCSEGFRSDEQVRHLLRHNALVLYRTDGLETSDVWLELQRSACVAE